MISDTIRTPPVPAASRLIDGVDTALRLRFRGGQRSGQTVRISARKCTIGSSPECTLRLVCPGVQAVHCLIIRGQSGMAIRRWSVDTFLNGRSFTDAPLLPGDRLTIGPVELEVLPELPTYPGMHATAVPPSVKCSSHLDHAVNRIAELEGRIQQRRTETETLIAELRSLSNELDDARSRQRQVHTVAPPMDRYRRELDQLAAQIELQRNDYQRDRSTWLEQCRQIASSLEAVRQLQASMAQRDSSGELDQRFRDLLSREQELRQQQAELERVRGEFDNRVREWEAECEHSRDHLERARTELECDRNAWQMHRHEEQARLDERARDLEAASEALRREQASLGGCQSQQQAAQEAKQKLLEADLASLRTKLEQAEQQKRQLLTARDSLRQQLEAQTQDCEHRRAQEKQWESERASLQTRLESKEHELSELQATWERERQDAARSLADREQEIQDKLERLRGEQLSLEQARADWESLREASVAQNGDEQVALQSIAESQAALDDERAAFAKQRQAWDEQRRQLDDELSSRQFELDEQFKQLQQQQHVLGADRADMDAVDVSGLQARVEEIEAERQRLLTTANESEATRQQLENRLQQLEAEQQRQVAAVEASEAEREELRSAVEESEAKRQELQVRLVELEEAQQASEPAEAETGRGQQLQVAAAETEAIRQELQSRLNELEAVQLQQAAAAEAHEAQRRDLDVRLEALEKERQQAHQEIEQARQQLGEERKLFEQELAMAEQRLAEANANCQHSPLAEPESPSELAQESEPEQQNDSSDESDHELSEIHAIDAEIPPADAISVNQTMSVDMLEQLRAEAARGTNSQLADAADATLVIEPTDDSADTSAEEEVLFTTPIDEPIVNTAAILAKFGQVEEPLEPTRSFAPRVEPDAPNGDGNDDINDYMTQLMQRVGGTYQAPQSEDPARASAPVAKPTPRKIPTHTPSFDTTPMDPSEFVPRAVAPEASSNLKELRAVANSSARSAIDKHQRKRLEQISMVFGFIAIVTLMVGATLACWARTLVSLPSLIASLSILGCLVSGFTALKYSSKARYCGESTHKNSGEHQAVPATKSQAPSAAALPEVALQDAELGSFTHNQVETGVAADK